MILPIYAFGEKMLRAESQEINEGFPDLNKLVADLYETMYHTKGVGIAAPQVGIPARLFVVDSHDMYEEHEQHKGIKQIFINPVINNESGMYWDYEEGCLSIPGIREKVRRRENIEIRYLDEKFEMRTGSFDGFNARVIQHEYDHLNGVLFIDKLSPLRKQILKGKLFAISRGDVKVDYKMVFQRYKR